MKRILWLVFLVTLGHDLAAQEFLHFTDFYVSGGYRNQPYKALNQRLQNAGYQDFGEHAGIVGIGINHFNSSRWGLFAESELTLHKKRSSNDEVNYRYLPLHVTAGVQYRLFPERGFSQWNFYPRLGLFYGTTSLDLLANNLNRDFDDNITGAMNSSFLYQRNYGLNFSLNADKIIGAFIKPTTQVGIYSRFSLQAGYIWNVLNSRTKLRRNFNPDIRDDFAIRNSPTFDPSAFYIKANIGLGKFKRTIKSEKEADY
ncbi:hypothetical protein KIH41_14445 [Litoribacter ruber]|uniref:Uncharacterized protein n=1 Tax=Litoribacter ruber TaxID=702568 RepID=A0AAP2CGI2_9BACT|nr:MULTISPECIES: hypothetical protein [Litoribacter]MBS9523390.1 hypothetical protein [Litoribacter alkaliphilus]MBT0812484.1 hypothetical protein [Litoribacter ruber]